LHLLYFHQHFTTPAGSGGIRSYAFAQELIRRGHKVTMVCGRGDRAGLNLPFDNQRGWYRGDIDGIDVIALPLEYSNHMGVWRRLGSFLRYAWASVVIALREDYDLVFATSTPLTAAIPGVFARWFRRKPFVFEVRDLWPELPRAMGMKNPILLGGMWLLEGLAYRSSVACIGLAPGIAEGIRRRSKADHPIAMIPNGCDLDIFSPTKRTKLDIPGIDEGDFVAGFTGAHGRANGLDAVLDCAAELKRRGELRIKLLLIGDGSEKPRLMRRAEVENLDNVIFHDPLPKTRLASVTASLGCGLMVLDNIPAFYNGTSPNKFFDYIASGIPVVINYPGWISELIQQSDAGSAVAPESALFFADALQALSSGETRTQMGINARKLAVTRFSRETLAQAFANFIESKGN
jgi:glycosyltransferase involved in cell wall biosynthesis